MSVLIVIPARYASVRFPGKALVELKGCSGKITFVDPAQLGCGHVSSRSGPGGGGHG